MNETKRNHGTIAVNIRKYAAALENILDKLPDEEDRRMASLALQGIKAESVRVNGVETVFCIGIDLLTV